MGCSVRHKTVTFSYAEVGRTELVGHIPHQLLRSYYKREILYSMVQNFVFFVLALPCQNKNYMCTVDYRNLRHTHVKSEILLLKHLHPRKFPTIQYGCKARQMGEWAARMIKGVGVIEGVWSIVHMY